MKKKNIICLLLLCFLLNGCTATYTMTINNSISDKLELFMSKDEYKEFNSDSSNYVILQYANQENVADEEPGVKVPGAYYYEMVKDDLNYKATYTSTFDNSKITESALIKNVFTNYIYRRTQDELYIKTNKEFYFPYENLTSVKIVLQSPYKVLYSNATSTNGNQLIWNVTRKNANNFYIEVNYYVGTDTDSTSDNNQNTPQDSNKPTDTQTDDTNNQKNSNPLTGIIIATIVLALSVGIIITIITLKIKKNQINKI